MYQLGYRVLLHVPFSCQSSFFLKKIMLTHHLQYVNMNVCVYTDVFNHTFLSREIKSHISEMDNVKVKATVYPRVYVQQV